MSHRLCPVWIGYLLASPLRKLRQNPRTILAPFVRHGMIALDVGSALGFFSIPLAEAVGPDGRVVCLDVQPRMLRGLEKRARKAGVEERIETRLCEPDALGIGDLAGKVDFALVFAVAHEAPEPEALLAEIRATLKPRARVLLAEPKGVVPASEWAAMLDAAGRAGLAPTAFPSLGGVRAAVLETPARTERER